MEEEKFEKACNIKNIRSNLVSPLEDCKAAISGVEKFSDEYPQRMCEVKLFGFNADISPDIVRRILIEQKERLESKILELKKEFEDL